MYFVSSFFGGVGLFFVIRLHNFGGALWVPVHPLLCFLRCLGLSRLQCAGRVPCRCQAVCTVYAGTSQGIHGAVYKCQSSQQPPRSSPVSQALQLHSHHAPARTTDMAGSGGLTFSFTAASQSGLVHFQHAGCPLYLVLSSDLTSVAKGARRWSQSFVNSEFYEMC